jgi:hypothetical protein
MNPGDKVNAPHRKDAVGGLTEIATFQHALYETTDNPLAPAGPMAQVEYGDGEVRPVPLDSLTPAS